MAEVVIEVTPLPEGLKLGIGMNQSDTGKEFESSLVVKFFPDVVLQLRMLYVTKSGLLKAYGCDIYIFRSHRRFFKAKLDSMSRVDVGSVLETDKTLLLCEGNQLTIHQ